MIKEFKTFISKGNVLEMAVGLIMATYFGAIIKSLVADIIMPPIGLAMGGVDFAELKVVLQDAVAEAEGVVAVPEVAIAYGSFINTIITFVIVAFCIFLV
ncbi:MAG TPA: large conductance mechanosensitive channel protein MscL, partial [Flavobacteriales bacterium]|nr:large conductance mechanosensitive channel protein MscL [Flavobacteriales bacterium]